MGVLGDEQLPRTIDDSDLEKGNQPEGRLDSDILENLERDSDVKKSCDGSKQRNVFCRHDFHMYLLTLLAMYVFP